MNLMKKRQKNINLKVHKITMKKLKKQVKGITLIALVVTVIVLLILAGVAISLTVGDNGLFRRAQNAADTWQMAEQNEQKEMEQAGEFIDDYVNNITRVDEVPIPNGFYYAGGSEETGLVISDNPADKKDWDEKTATDIVPTNLEGNQFVWVPVENRSALFTTVEDGKKLNGVNTVTKVYSNLEIFNLQSDIIMSGAPGDTGTAREPDILDNYDTNEIYYRDILGFKTVEDMANSFVEEYMSIYQSINKYNGFYIGRYELTGTVEEPTVKKGKVLTSALGQAERWYQLYNSSKNILNKNENVKSTMIFSFLWDATCNWLSNEYDVEQDSSNWGNYSGALIETGSNNNYEAKGIYDLAGNYWEWTQEALNDTRSVRGGYANIYGPSGPALMRDDCTPNLTSGNITTRVILYIK